MVLRRHRRPRARFAPRSCSGSLSLSGRRRVRCRSHRSGRLRHRAARSRLRRRRRAVPLPRHSPLHHRRHDCRRCCRPARHGASHRCPRSRRRGRPLTRRGGSPPPGSPASISRPPVQRESGSDPPGRASVFTPHASRMQPRHGVPFRGLAGSSGVVRGPCGCWSERMARAMRGLSSLRALSGTACHPAHGAAACAHGAAAGPCFPRMANAWRVRRGYGAGMRPAGRARRAQSPASRRSDSWKARASATSASTSSRRPSRTIASRLSVARNQV